MKKVLILNGPNLNMLGTREPEIYGRDTLEDIENMCLKKAASLEIEIAFQQSNSEGQLIDWIQRAYKTFDAIIINAGAYSHTSIAIHDALKAVNLKIAEVHISDPKKRESFRHFSYIEELADVYIAGQGAKGYIQALEKINDLLKK